MDQGQLTNAKQGEQLIRGLMQRGDGCYGAWSIWGRELGRAAERTSAPCWEGTGEEAGEYLSDMTLNQFSTVRSLRASSAASNEKFNLSLRLETSWGTVGSWDPGARHHGHPRHREGEIMKGQGNGQDGARVGCQPRGFLGGPLPQDIMQRVHKHENGLKSDPGHVWPAQKPAIFRSLL